ncbi:soluble lamin-associated protein of 75 kDa [Porphyrio hochstetteri]
MSFPVDMLNNCSHSDVERSGETYMSHLRCVDPDQPEYFTVPQHGKIPIKLSSVGFVPIYGEDETYKVLALFAPRDQLTAVALYLADQWWLIDDIVKTSSPDRQGLQQVESVGERIVLYVLNRIIYRTQEMGRNDIYFLCHGSNDYAKIFWKKGEAIGFYSVKPKDSVCNSYGSEKYKLSVLYTMFVRRKHRGIDSGLIILEDFVNSFVEEQLGLRYPLTPFAYTEYLAVTTLVQSRSSIKRSRIGRTRLESAPGTSQGVVEKTHVSERSELPAHTSERSEDSVSEDNTAQKDEEGIVKNENQSVSEVDLHVSHTEKQSEREETPLEPLNGEVTEEVGKTSLAAEEEVANEVLSDELKLQSETRGEEPLTLIVPLILESQEKPSGDTVTEEVRGSEFLSDESTLIQEDSEEEEEPENVTVIAAPASKDEPSDNGLPDAVVAEESVFENVSPKTASSLEEQNEEAGHNSQEAPTALSQGSLIVVELEGVSLQQPSGQEGQKNQPEEHSEESAEQMDHYMQAAAERAADSSSEEAEIEVPIVDRRNLRRKAKGYKGPPRKKGKSV